MGLSLLLEIPAILPSHGLDVGPGGVRGGTLWEHGCRHHMIARARSTPTARTTLALGGVALLAACGQPSAPSPAPHREPTPVPAAGSVQAGVPDDDVVDRFIVSVAPAFQATRRGEDEIYPLSPHGPLPRRVEAWSFVDLDAAPPSSGVRLRFSLRTFEYASAGEATNALVELSAAADDSMLLKAPLLAVRLGSSVLRLDGACSFSRDRWVEVQDALIAALPSGEATPDDALEILCGGAAVRAPASGPTRGEGRQDPARHGVEE
jgi:hypothetical protein